MTLSNDERGAELRELFFESSQELLQTLNDEALKLTPNSPAALYGRGVAKLMKGDVAASNADFEVAKEIKPSIVEEFTKVGVQTTKKSFFQ